MKNTEAQRAVAKKRQPPPQMVTGELTLKYIPPFDWQSVVQFYRSHQIAGIEVVSETAYGRVFKIDGTIGSIEVTPHSKGSFLVLKITAAHESVFPEVEARLRRMFGLDADLFEVTGIFGKHPYFGMTWGRCSGLRLQSSWDPYEMAINTVLGQLVSVKRANDLMKQLVEAHGEKIVHPVTGEKAYLFPQPETLASASLEELGTTKIRKRTIRELSRLIAQNEIDLTSKDIAGLKKALLAIPGIGPWTVEYIALRALGDSDSFPGTDLVLKRLVDANPEMNVEGVRPWRSYAAVCLWKQYADEQLRLKGAAK